MTESTDRPTWITDRLPLPVDANEYNAVRVQLLPECETFVDIHYTYVAQGVPWRHSPGWTFPEIRLGQTWRCEDGKERVVKRGHSNFWLIGEYHYTNDGEAPGLLTSARLAELISQPEPEPQQEPRPEPEPQPRRRFASLNGYVGNGEEILLAIDTDGVAWTSTAGFQWVRVVDLPND